jgi:hypothetical protein
VETISWRDVLGVQGLYALGASAFVVAGAAVAGPAVADFMGASASPEPWLIPAVAAGVVLLFTSLVFAASRSDYELPVLRALLAACGLLVAVALEYLGFAIPFALAWGLAFGLALRAPDARAWVMRGIVLAVTALFAPALALLFAPVAVRAGDSLSEQIP